MQTLARGWHLNLFCQSHKLLVCLEEGMREKLRGPRIRPPVRVLRLFSFWLEVCEVTMLAPVE